MKTALKFLIVDDVHLYLMDRLDNLNIQFSYQPTIHSDEIAEELKEYNGIVVRSKLRLDATFIESQPQLKIIARAGSGMDNIDLDAAMKKGITCINAAEANSDSVGEQTLGMLLSLNHNITKSNNEVKKSVWDREGNRGQEIKNKTVGIVGYGNTGSAVAKKLSGFGCRTIAYDKYKQNYSNDFVEEVDLEYLMTESDVISFHIPLTAETSGWICDNWINNVTKNFVLLNLSRGGIMKTTDVIEGLKSGKISALGCDVLENEILESFNSNQRQAFEWLNDQENVVITPHIGGWTTESYERISNVLAKKIETWVKSATTKAKSDQKIGRFVV
jgi:D-3-phosphoglycerate dehydrogenase / 2-oxoglutarate reductase